MTYKKSTFYLNKILLYTFKLSEKSKHEYQTVRRKFIQSKVDCSTPQKPENTESDRLIFHREVEETIKIAATKVVNENLH